MGKKIRSENSERINYNMEWMRITSFPAYRRPLAWLVRLFSLL